MISENRCIVRKVSLRKINCMGNIGKLIKDINFFLPSSFVNLRIKGPKRASSDVEFSTFDRPSVECRIFDIRSALLGSDRIYRIFDIRSAISRKSNIRHPMHVRSNVENPTSEEARLSDVGFLTFDPPSIECQIFDIRLCGQSNRKDPIQQ